MDWIGICWITSIMFFGHFSIIRANVRAKGQKVHKSTQWRPIKVRNGVARWALMRVAKSYSWGVDGEKDFVLDPIHSIHSRHGFRRFRHCSCVRCVPGVWWWFRVSPKHPLPFSRCPSGSVLSAFMALFTEVTLTSCNVSPDTTLPGGTYNGRIERASLLNHNPQRSHHKSFNGLRGSINVWKWCRWSGQKGYSPLTQILTANSKYTWDECNWYTLHEGGADEGADWVLGTVTIIAITLVSL